jgi:hypothetical protein
VKRLIKIILVAVYVCCIPVLLSAQIRNYDPMGKRTVIRAADNENLKAMAVGKADNLTGVSSADLQVSLLKINLLLKIRTDLNHTREELLITMSAITGTEDFENKSKQIDCINCEIKKIEEKISTLRNDISKAWKDQRLTYWLFKKKKKGDNAAQYRNEEVRELIIGKDTRILPNLGIQGSSDRGVVYTELATDAIFNALHISFGSVLAAANEEVPVDEKNITRLFAGGGNGIMDLSLPIGYHRGKNGTLFVSLGGRMAGDLPALGNTPNEAAGNLSVYLDFYSEFASANRVFNFFVYAKASAYTGSKSFFDNLELPDSRLDIGQLNVGVTINQTVRIAALIPMYSNYGKIVRQSILIGAQLINIR